MNNNNHRVLPRQGWKVLECLAFSNHRLNWMLGMRTEGWTWQQIVWPSITVVTIIQEHLTYVHDSWDDEMISIWTLFFQCYIYMYMYMYMYIFWGCCTFRTFAFAGLSKQQKHHSVRSLCLGCSRPEQICWPRSWQCCNLEHDHCLMARNWSWSICKWQLLWHKPDT